MGLDLLQTLVAEVEQALREMVPRRVAPCPTRLVVGGGPLPLTPLLSHKRVLMELAVAAAAPRASSNLEDVVAHVDVL